MRFLKSAAMLLVLMLLTACPGPLSAAAADGVLTVNDPEISVLRAQLEDGPAPQHVRLTGTLPSLDALIRLKNDFPGIVFEWEFDMFGIPVSTLSEHIDISGIPVPDVQAVEALLPAFYDLKTIDMVDCGISDAEMDGLNLRHPETEFVWEVWIAYRRIRTDIRYYMPVQFKMADHPNNDFSNLRYCRKCIVVDLGHYVVNDTSFVEYMPDLQYLQLCMATIDDLSSIGRCTSLRFLELFLNPVTDFWPLTNLTNLEDLNISYTSCVHRYSPRRYQDFGDITPLLQMTWLDRLWVASTNLLPEDLERLQAALPETVILSKPGSSTNYGWRHCPNYYAARDILGMKYMYI